MKVREVKENLVKAAISTAIIALVAISVLGKPIAIGISSVDTDYSGDENSRTATISVIGMAQGEYEPDQMVISLTIESKDETSPDLARKGAAEIVSKVISSLEKIGVEEDDIETTNYNLYPEYDWTSSGKIFRGYRAIYRMKVTVRDFDKAGKVLDTCIKAGAFVGRVYFEISRERREEIRNQLLAEAARDAKEKAEIIVSALGGKLGKLISVNYNNYGYIPRIYKGEAFVNEFDYDTSTQILPKDLTISVKLSVTFEVIQD